MLCIPLILTIRTAVPYVSPRCVDQQEPAVRGINREGVAGTRASDVQPAYSLGNRKKKNKAKQIPPVSPMMKIGNEKTKRF